MAGLADHKAKLLLMLGKPKGEGPEADDDEGEDEPDADEEGEKASMGEFISAVKSGDVEAACEAFKDLKNY